MAAWAAFPNIGIYHASKWGLEGFSEALSYEVAEFGIKVTLVEPSGFATDWAGSSAKQATPIAAYAPAHAAMAERRKRFTPGDPKGTVKAILQLVDSEDPPLRLLLGSAAVQIAMTLYQRKLATWKAWEGVSKDVQTRNRFTSAEDQDAAATWGATAGRQAGRGA